MLTAAGTKPQACPVECRERPRPQPPVCSNHQLNTVDVWCVECNQPYCVQRQMQRQEPHTLLSMDKIASERKEALETAIGHLQIDADLKHAAIRLQSEERSAQVAALVQNINSVFDDALWQLNRRKQSFLSYFQAVAQIDLERSVNEEEAINEIHNSVAALQLELGRIHAVDLMSHDGHLKRRLEHLALAVHRPVQTYLFKDRHFVLDSGSILAAAINQLGALSAPLPLHACPWLCEPQGIAVSGDPSDPQQHRIYVADARHEKVLVFNSTNKCLFKISALSRGDDDSPTDSTNNLAVPQKLAVDPTGSIIVVGYASATIVFDREGKPRFRLPPTLDLTMDSRRGHIVLLDRNGIVRYSVETGALLSRLPLPINRGAAVELRPLAVTYDRGSDRLVVCTPTRILFLGGGDDDEPRGYQTITNNSFGSSLSPPLSCSPISSSPALPLASSSSSSSSSSFPSPPSFTSLASSTFTLRELSVDETYHFVAAHHPFLFLAAKDLRVVDCWRRMAGTHTYQRLAPICGLLGRGGGMAVQPSTRQLLVTSRMSHVVVSLPFPD